MMIVGIQIELLSKLGGWRTNIISFYKDLDRSGTKAWMSTNSKDITSLHYKHFIPVMYIHYIPDMT